MAKPPKAKVIRGSTFAVSKAMQARYERQLRRVARIVGGIVASQADGATIRNAIAMQSMLGAYSDALTPWAERVAGDMLRQANARNRAAWISTAKTIGRELTAEVLDSPIGALQQALMREQVALIKSMPIEAGLRAQKIAQEAALGGKRPEVAAKEIAETEGVTISRATLIARTEAARASSTLTEARAASVGSPGYLWRTVGDAETRESHREMEGRFVAWSDPPTLSDGTTTHAGQIYNCRCYAEPVL